MPNIGPLELIVVLAIVLLIFGPKRLPGLGKQLGSGMREFKESISGKDKDKDDDDADVQRPALTQAAADVPAPPPAPAAEAPAEREPSRTTQD